MPGLVEAHFHATYFNVAALEEACQMSSLTMSALGRGR